MICWGTPVFGNLRMYMYGLVPVRFFAAQYQKTINQFPSSDPCHIDSYHSYRRISIHWHLKIPTSQAGAVILRVHQVKERLCHSTPSGGYGIARGASSPVSMAGETVAALDVLETKRCNCGDRWGEMQRSALPHQQVISVI